MVTGWLRVALAGCLVTAAGLGSLTAASRITLAWDASGSSLVTGYRVYYGISSRNYTNMLDVGNTTSATVSNLAAGVTYYFAATAYDLVGLESDFSSEISFAVPYPTLQLRIRGSSANAKLLTIDGPAGRACSVVTSTNLVNWVLLTNVTTDASGTYQLSVQPNATDLQRFFRLVPTSP